ncbi:MAG: hypothetical protein KA173_04765 [Rhodoferax sp.]|nr:hypothetical protein [Rhodoferax sp.]MBP7492575.1 hypothetical protein [Rhodoferax sp.]
MHTTLTRTTPVQLQHPLRSSKGGALEPMLNGSLQPDSTPDEWLSP